MKQIKRKDRHFDENIATQNSTSTDFTKKNKMLFYKTISSNFSQEQNKNQKSFRNQALKNQNIKTIKKSEKGKSFSPNKNFKSINETPIKKKQSIVSIHNSPKKEDSKNQEITLKINSLLPTNINSYQHLIRGTDFGIYDNLNWALRLRDYSYKGINNTKVIDYKDYYYRENAKTTEIKHEEKIQLTENFNPPSYYEADLEKYKKRMKSGSKPLLMQLNPNYNKIRHLLFGNNKGKVNYSQFSFESTLRNLKSGKNDERKKWEILPAVKNNNRKYMTKFFAPITSQGIQNLKNMEKYLPKNYEYNLKDIVVGEDKVKKRIMYNNRNYTISGIGETLGDQKYNNVCREKNIFAHQKILTTATNEQCKFELSLRFYETNKDKKAKTQANFRPKKK